MDTGFFIIAFLIVHETIELKIDFGFLGISSAQLQEMELTHTNTILVAIATNEYIHACTLHNTLHKKWSFSLWISSVNVTKSAGNCVFGHNYWRNPKWKTSFFVQWYLFLFPLKQKDGLRARGAFISQTDYFLFFFSFSFRFS